MLYGCKHKRVVADQQAAVISLTSMQLNRASRDDSMNIEFQSLFGTGSVLEDLERKAATPAE